MTTDRTARTESGEPPPPPQQQQTPVLEINICGLCLLRPAELAEGGGMFVLLPPVGSHGGHHVEPHLALLAWDPAYESGGVKAKLGDFPPRFRKIAGRDVITDIPAAAKMPLPKGLDNASARFDTAVDASLPTGGVDPDVLTARLRFPEASSAPTLADGAIWEFEKGKPVEMPTGVTWTARLANAAVNWLVDGATRPEFPPLLPIGNKVAIYVLHIPLRELPDKLPPEPEDEPIMPGTEAHHYAGYFALLEPRGHYRKVPRFVKKKDRLEIRGVSVVTCMSGGGEP